MDTLIFRSIDISIKMNFHPLKNGAFFWVLTTIEIFISKQKSIGYSKCLGARQYLLDYYIRLCIRNGCFSWPCLTIKKSHCIFHYIFEFFYCVCLSQIPWVVFCISSIEIIQQVCLMIS